MQVTGTTFSAGKTYNDIYFALGNLAGASNGAGKVGGFYTIIPHYKSSSLHKSGITGWIVPNNADYFVGLTANFWNNTAPISQIKFFVTGGFNMVTGMAISIYGIY